MDRKIACLLGCPDEADPARLCVAYVRDHGDELGRCDIRNMRDLLIHLGYAVNVVPRKAKIETAVHQYLKDIAASCEASDEFLFYFSGHGRWSLDGEFVLVLADKEILPGRALLRELKNCQARTKLMILDCCFAGAIEAFWPTQRHDLRLLVASNEDQKAFQDPDGVGSDFTHLLTRALSDSTLRHPTRDIPLADADGRIAAHALVDWLRAEMVRIGEQRNLMPSQVPVPLALPRDVDFSVARIPADRSLGYPFHFRQTLQAAFLSSCVDAAAVLDSWDYCRARQSNGRLSALPTGTALWEHFRILLDPELCYVPSDRLQLPLITFVARLLRGLDSDGPLHCWLDDAVHWLRRAGYPRDEIRKAEDVDQTAVPSATTEPAHDPCLLVEVARHTGRDRYRVSWDLIDVRGDTVSKTDPGPPMDRTALPGAIADIIGRLSGDTVGHRVEIALPAQLLADDALIDRLERLALWDGVCTDPSCPLGNGHLAHERALVFRCWERWGGTAQDAVRYAAPRYREHYQTRSDCVARPPVAPCLQWIGIGSRDDAAQRAARALTIAAVERRPLAIALALRPDMAVLERLLGTGAPILLWPRHRSPSPNQLKTLKGDLPLRCEPHGLARLPAALLEYRRHCTAIGAPAASYVPALLWDTPEHLKYDQPDYDPDLMLEPPP